MLRTILVLGLLAMSLASPHAIAQAAPAGASQPAPNAIDPASIQALAARVIEALQCPANGGNIGDLGRGNLELSALPGTHRL